MKFQYNRIMGDMCTGFTKIDSESGIIFSSGKYTAGKDFCAEKVQEWFQKCEERKKHPKFNFVEV